MNLYLPLHSWALGWLYPGRDKANNANCLVFNGVQCMSVFITISFSASFENVSSSIPSLFVLWWWFCIKMANWGRETNLTTVQHCTWNLRCRGKVQVRGILRICEILWQYLYMSLNLYFCSVSVFLYLRRRRVQLEVRGKSGIKLWGNYAAAQPTCLHYTLPVPIKQERM